MNNAPTATNQGVTMTATSTYSQQAAHAHSVGGQTQAEATASISNLRKVSIGWLRSVLTSLEAEAAACHSQHDYDYVRAQVVRVRSALRSRS